MTFRIPRLFFKKTQPRERSEPRPVRDEPGYAGPITTSDGYGDDPETRLTFFHLTARRFLLGDIDAEHFGREVEAFFPAGETPGALSSEERDLIGEVWGAATGFYGNEPLEPRLRSATEALWVAVKGSLPE